MKHLNLSRFALLVTLFAAVPGYGKAMCILEPGQPKCSIVFLPGGAGGSGSTVSDACQGITDMETTGSCFVLVKCAPAGTSTLDEDVTCEQCNLTLSGNPLCD